nr:uncharacterized protein LOC111425208 [Onthophagus taurus]
MKFLVFTFLFVIVTAEILYTKEQIETTNAILNGCVEVTKIKPEKIEDMKNRIFDEDQTAKEYILCIYKKFRFIEEDGTINKGNLRKFFGQHALAGATLDKCIDEKGDSPAATTYLIAKCYIQGLPPDVKGWL